MNSPNSSRNNNWWSFGAKALGSRDSLSALASLPAVAAWTHFASKICISPLNRIFSVVTCNFSLAYRKKAVKCPFSICRRVANVSFFNMPTSSLIGKDVTGGWFLAPGIDGWANYRIENKNKNSRNLKLSWILLKVTLNFTKGVRIRQAGRVYISTAQMRSPRALSTSTDYLQS